MRAAAAGCLLLLLAGLAPAAQATLPPDVTVSVAPARTTLYFHLIGEQDFPINTQEPDGNYTDASHYGAASSTLTCVGSAAPVSGSAALHQEYHTDYGYASPSLVEYGNLQNGMPRTHPERGIGYDADFDPGVPVVVDWYLRTSNEAAPASAGGPGMPLPVPNVVVKATMREGDSISVDDRAYNAGALVAQGQTDPVTLAGDQVVAAGGQGAAQVTKVSGSPAGEPYVYRFAVPMTLHLGALSRATGFNVRIDVFADNPACGDPATTGSVMPSVVDMWSAPGARPRMELGVLHPLRLDALAVVPFNNSIIVVHSALASPWGTYDIDPSSVRLQLDGPTPATLVPQPPVRRSYEECCGRPVALDEVFVWNDTAAQAKGGPYQATLMASNLQHTAILTATFAVEVGRQEQLPGPGLPALALVLAGLALAVARRR